MSARAVGDGDAVARADELLTRVTGEVRRFAERVVGRVREEAEDVWAEARSERDAPSTARRGR